MSKKAKSTPMNTEKIIALYMEHVLEHENFPKSVYKFCKVNNLQEDEFYKSFGSFEGLQVEIWNNFYTNTINLLEKNKDYGTYGNQDKMLSFFYTMFELLTLNRSYVLFALKEHKSKFAAMAQLKGLRKNIKNYATSLIEEANESKNLKVTKQSPVIFSEGAWVQFLFLLKFWMDDTSAGFERTDMAIEKSVNTIFDVFDNTPLDSIIDFGKFLYKETMT